MKLKSLLNWIAPQPEATPSGRIIKRLIRRNPPKTQTVSQTGVQARAIHHLIAHGRIDAMTIQRMGTTDARKMLTRMRRLGLLFAADDINGHFRRQNASGSGYHRVHLWTGKVPANWATPKVERRKRVRGGR